jgi:lactoylglutathione lyase
VATIDLARGLLDPGLFSDNAPTMERFYEDTIGLPLFERLPHSDTYQEVFFKLPPGKLKIQAFATPMEKAVTGYAELMIASDKAASVSTYTDPDGLTVHLVPRGHRGVTVAGYVCRVPDPDAQTKFYLEGMGAQRVDGGGLRVGDTMLFVEEGPLPGAPTPCARTGFVYITIIAHDCAAAHKALLAGGGEHSLRILRLADRCLFSWVRDPNGNWVEVVQYAELSGPLPDIARLADNWDGVTRWREQGVPY